MSRRTAIQMSDEEVADFLAQTRTITIVSQGPRGYPHPMPMWYVTNPDGTIRMTTYRTSQKVRNIERDPHVSLMAEAGETYEELRGVVLYGHAELIDDPALIAETIVEAATKGVAGQAPSEAMEKAAAKRVVIRVTPEQVVSWDHRKLGGVY